jgi:hypothetical protein
MRLGAIRADPSSQIKSLYILLKKPRWHGTSSLVFVACRLLICNIICCLICKRSSLFARMSCTASAQLGAVSISKHKCSYIIYPLFHSNCLNAVIQQRNKILNKAVSRGLELRITQLVMLHVVYCMGGLTHHGRWISASKFLLY